MNKITQLVAFSAKRSLLLPSLLALGSMVFSLSHGSAILTDIDLILKLRLARTLAGFTAGGLLALSGCLTQLLLLNPLADPYILGISGGAAFATLSLLMMGVTGFELFLGGWIGSAISISVILILSYKQRMQSQTLLLTGIALASGYSAGITFLLLMSDDANVHTLLFWLCGDLTVIKTPWFEMLILCFGVIACFALAPGLNLLYRNEEEAVSLGLAYSQYRLIVFLLSSLFTTTAVTLTGTIGFLGLIVPHVARQWFGLNHQQLVPASVLLGGSLLVTADTIARTIIAPQQLTVGVVLVLIGVPCFVHLLRR